MQITILKTKINTGQADNRSKVSALLLAAIIFLAFLTLTVAVLSIEHAEWTNPQPSLMLTLTLATVIGIILANWRFQTKIAVSLLVVIGLLFVFWQSVTIFEPTDELTSFQIWQQTISGNLPSENFIYFSMFLIYVTWLIGGFSIWSAARFRNAWIAIITGGAMLLINLNNLPRENYHYFIYFFILALTFLAVSRLANTNQFSIKWQQQKHAREVLVYFFTSVVLISTVVVVIAYSFPTPALNNIGIKIDTSSIGGANMQKLSLNVFRSITSKWGTIKSNENNKLFFKDSLDTSNKIDFIITSSTSDYWCTRRYDEYQSWGWTSTADTDTRLSAGLHINYADTLEVPKSAIYTVENRKRTDVVLSRGSVVSADIPINILTFGSDSNSSPLNNPDIAALTTTQIMRPYQTYKIQTNLVNTSPEALSSAGTDYPDWVTARYLQVPRNQPRILSISRRTTEKAKTPYEKVIAVKNYLQTFTYDPGAPPTPESLDGVDYFLFTSKKGVCTNFASAMAVMLRESGVPTRLCTGYLSGELDKTKETYLIRGKNTHAWVEVFFPKYGWITVESTPASGTEAGNQPAVLDSNESDLALEQDSPLPWWMESDLIPEDAAAGGEGNLYPPTRFPLIPTISVVVLLAAYLVSRWYFIRWANRLKSIDSPYQAYDRMSYIAKLGDFGPKTSDTPLEFRRRLLNYIPEEIEDIDTVINLYNETRYGYEKKLPVYKLTTLQTTWVRLFAKLFKQVLRIKTWFPIKHLLSRWVED